MAEAARGARCLHRPWALGLRGGREGGKGPPTGLEPSSQPSRPAHICHWADLVCRYFQSHWPGGETSGHAALLSPCLHGPSSCPHPQHWGPGVFPTRPLEQLAGPSSWSQARTLKNKTYLGMIFGLHALNIGQNSAVASPRRGIGGWPRHRT